MHLLQRLIAKSILTLLFSGLVACHGSTVDDTAPERDTVLSTTVVSEPKPLPAQWQSLLASRQVDYARALRRTSLRLCGRLPTVAEIRELSNATDPAVVYADLVERYSRAPAASMQYIDFFRMLFGTGLPAGSDSTEPGRIARIQDSAAVYAAQLVVEDRPYSDLFTTQSCPHYYREDNRFEARDCNAAMRAADNADSRRDHHKDPIPDAGICSHPGIQKAYFSNLGFKRVRFYQEKFYGRAFPAHIAAPQDIGGAAPYTCAYPLDGITGNLNAPENHDGPDFHANESVVCANCHCDMNRRVLLLGAYFDRQGAYSSDPEKLQVRAPSGRLATRRDYLPDGEPSSLHFGSVAADTKEMCAQMGADPAVHCAMAARLWNWALGRGDVIEDKAEVPPAVLEPLCAEFGKQNLNIRALIVHIFTHEDLIKF